MGCRKTKIVENMFVMVIATFGHNKPVIFGGIFLELRIMECIYIYMLFAS